MPLAFPSLRLIHRNGFKDSPRLVRVDDRNRIVEELRRITVVNVTLSDGEGTPVDLPVLVLEDEPGDLEGGSGGGGGTASSISFTPNGSIAATNVQDAIQEVRDEAGGGGAARIFRIELTETGKFMDRAQVATDLGAYYTAGSLTPAKGDVLFCWGANGSYAGWLNFMVTESTDDVGSAFTNFGPHIKFTVASVDYYACQIGPNYFF